MGKALVVLNPGARNAAGPSLLALVRSELEMAGFSAEVAVSASADDLVALAKSAAGAGVDRIVACGGDGTIRLVARGLFGSRIPMGIVPLGTTNVLAAELGLPAGRPSGCASIAARGREIRIGLGTVGGDEVFTFCASAGLDSIAVQRVDLQMKGELGRWAYAHSAFVSLLEAAPPVFEVEAGGRRLPAVQVFAARGRRYGGARWFVSKKADVTSGIFQVIVLPPPAFASLAMALPRFVSGGIEGCPGAVCFETDHFCLIGDGRLPVQADGDLLPRVEPVFSSHPDALTVIGP